MQQHRSAVANAPAGEAPRPIKLLALHSFRTSGSIFKQQLQRGKWLGELDSVLSPRDYELVFVDAPNPASGMIPKDVAPYFQGPYYEWLTVERHGDKLCFDEQKLERSLGAISDTLRDHAAARRPFDGVIGFSQGTAMASTVVALQSSGMALQDVPPLKFCVLFAGFQSQYPPHAEAWRTKIKVPSLHIYGDRDALRPQCKELADAFENSVVLQHTRGHSIAVPTPVHLAVARAFMASVTDAITSQEQQGQQQRAGGTVQRQPTSAAAATTSAGSGAAGSSSLSSSDEDSRVVRQQEGWRPGSDDQVIKSRL